MLPADPEIARGLRIATALHGGHACAGLVLGTRLAFEGARALGLSIPDRDKRLVVAVEIDRCAADAIQAVTGCRPGRRTMRVLDYGKLAATFIDLWSGAAVRVAARGDLRERSADLARPGEERHDAQRRVYRELPAGDLFSIEPSSEELDQYDLPGPPRRRVHCVTCGEEVSDGRDIKTEEGSRCRPCAARAPATNRSESQ
jgi:formylmethanofuran dehydrogenase subunit E